MPELLEIAERVLVDSRTPSSDLLHEESAGLVARSIELAAEETSFRVLGEVLRLDEMLEMPVSLVIAVYRRILELGGDDASTRLCFAGYLLMHGPQWDDEALSIKAEVDDVARAAGVFDAPHLGHHPVFFRG